MPSATQPDLKELRTAAISKYRAYQQIPNSDMRAGVQAETEYKEARRQYQEAAARLPGGSPFNDQNDPELTVDERLMLTSSS